MVEAPAESFHSLESLDPENRRLFNSFSRGPTIATPFKIVHHAFEAIATRHPDVIAVEHFDGTTISYFELNQRANILANELHRLGLRRGDRALLVYSRCIEMVVFILAVLKAGGQYVPLDGAVTPEAILKHVIVDSDAAIILCLPKFRSKIEQCMPHSLKEAVKVVEINSSSSLWITGDKAQPDVDIKTTDGAYVIYTSGTTGKPKGVDVTHEGVTNSLLLEPSNLKITVGTKVIQQLNVAFDMCAWEILGTMMNGGSLHIRGSGNEAWAQCLRSVDTLIATPSVVLKHMPQQRDFPNIKTIAVGGEPCPKSLADHWAPHVNFWNVCGPTEITILNSAHLHKPGFTLSIGKPNPNTNIYILDENENPVRIGDPGVMWAGGAGVSHGYLNLPEMTTSRYKPDKFARNGRNMFNTGDLARWLHDGSLEPLGRKDDQVKISGFRVELDGVSRSIEQCTTVTKACALKIGDALWGFYSAPAELDYKVLRQALASNQPFYAIPSVWKYLPTIGLTPNGKVDKAKLRSIAEAEKTDLFQVTDEKLVILPQPVYIPTHSELQHDDKTKVTLLESITMVGNNFDRYENKKLSTQPLYSVTPVSSTSSSNSITKTLYPLPPKQGYHGWRWFRHTALNAYRKLFGLIFIANAIPFVLMLWKGRHNSFSLPLPSLITAVASNLLGSVLLRQDHVVNTIYYLATRLPVSMPLWIRRHAARIYHNGGVHSGCAVSASIWWIIFAVETSRCYFAPHINRGQYHVNDAMMVITYLILALLMLILVMAYPSIRMKMHDQFECTHRFAGWTTLILVWTHLVVATSSLQYGKDEPLGKALALSPGLYLVALTTLSIASSWLTLRRVKVVAEPLSRHAVRLHFDFFTPRPSSSVGIRITDRPLVEWHSFAAIFSPSTRGFSIIVSRAGDWTGRIIEKPPTSIWTRGTPASGVLAIAPLFKKIILVATGSGIGPCMPVILEKRVPCRILWSAKAPLKTYGEEILATVYDTDPDTVLWDTATQGRPDLAALAYQMYRESDAECVCVISNKSTTAKLVYQLESRGVPAFGPIFDS